MKKSETYDWPTINSSRISRQRKRREDQMRNDRINKRNWYANVFAGIGAVCTLLTTFIFPFVMGFAPTWVAHDLSHLEYYDSQGEGMFIMIAFGVAVFCAALVAAFAYRLAHIIMDTFAGKVE